MVTLHITGDTEADRLLAENPLALMIGMLLDQQVPMEWAFSSPLRLEERMGADLDAATIAAMDPDRLESIFREKPALHRYPASMAKRVQALCHTIVEEYGGDARTVWTEATDAADLLQRLQALPGYGKEKSQIFLAVLAKRFGQALDGWETHAGRFAEPGYQSAADVDSPAALQKVREHKQMMKTAKKQR